MWTFARKPVTHPKNTTPRSTMPGRSQFGQSREVHSNLHLQRRIGNHDVQRLLQSNDKEHQPGPATTMTKRFRHDFSQIPVVNLRFVQMQPKLTVSTQGDNYEREANNIANKVMGMPDQRSDSNHPTQDNHEQGLCPACEVNNAAYPSVNGRQNRANTSVQAGFGGLGLGRALPVTTRQFFEPRFGYNFANVRVHTNMEASRSAAGFQAKAYTIGNDVVFAAGQYQPSTLQGQRLLAHELTHVIQQNTAISSPFVQRLANPSCGSATGLPFSDSCSNYNNVCYSSSFTGSRGSNVAVNVTVEYDDWMKCSFPEGSEDFRVQLKQCGWRNTEVKDLGTSGIGTTLTGTAVLPGAGIILGNDNYYLRVYSRSNCKLAASMRVT